MRRAPSGSARELAPLVLAAACAVACGRPAALARGPVLPPARATAAADHAHLRSIAHWEPIEIDLRPPPVLAHDLPLDEATVADQPAYARLDPATRVALREHGFVVASRAGGVTERLGAFHSAVRADGLPLFIGFDALFALAALGMDRALAEAEDRVIVPGIVRALDDAAARLELDARDPPADLLTPLRIARGVVAVARSLAAGATRAPADLAPVVKEELALVERRARPGRSPLLGVPVDYAAVAAYRGAGRPVRAGLHEACAWLAVARLEISATSESPSPGAPALSVGRARSLARAALLLSRATDPAVEPAAHEALEKVDRLLTFVHGAADDTSVEELGDLARVSGVDLGALPEIADVFRVDRIRRAIAARRPPEIADAGSRRPSVRLLPARASPDSAVLQSLVHPGVGPSATQARRALPSPLDIGTWFGSPEARTALHDLGLDAYERFEERLWSTYQLRPADEAALHASVHRSLDDAIATYLAPPAGAHMQSFSRSALWTRRQLEGGLAAWTLARHQGEILLRPPSAPLSVSAPRSATAAGPAVLVEPHPEAIAKLLGSLHQMHRGLLAQGGVAQGSPGHLALLEVESLVGTALEAAIAMVNDVPFSRELAGALATFATRHAALEDLLDPEASLVPVATPIHTDLHEGTTLMVATGPIEQAVFVVRDPGGVKVVAAVGAVIPPVAFAAASRIFDAAWRERVRGGATLQRFGFAQAYRPGGQVPSSAP